MLVATEHDKYHHIKANSSLFTTIEVLPGFRAVYSMVDCGSSKTPCLFDLLLCDTLDLTILLSCTHPFPSHLHCHFEREKVFSPPDKKFSLLFSKHCLLPNAHTKVYISLLSHSGGTIKIK